MIAMTVAECSGVSRSFAARGVPPVVAVNHVDFHVGRGEFVAIEGPSGSGKTTLVAMLAGLDLPDNGTVRILGHDTSRLSQTERARLRQFQVGIVFQTFGLIPSLNAIENVALPLAFEGVALVEREDRARAALSNVGLDGKAASRVDELSGGERQRVGVARALVIKPALILADEPTGSLDEQQGREIVDLLVSCVSNAGASLVLVTHDPISAALADRRYVMVDGGLSEAPR
jgi:putative ABC transport system ATP-binding protein